MALNHLLLYIAFYCNMYTHFYWFCKEYSFKLSLMGKSPKGYIQFVLETRNRTAGFIHRTRPGGKIDPLNKLSHFVWNGYKAKV